MNSEANATDSATAAEPASKAVPDSNSHSIGWNTKPVWMPWINV